MKDLTSDTLRFIPE